MIIQKDNPGSKTVEEALKSAKNAYAEGRMQEATKIFHRILMIDPKNAAANHGLGVLAVSGANALDSLSYFRSSLEFDPKNGKYWVSYVNALILAGKYDVASQLQKLSIKNGLDKEVVNTLDNLIANIPTAKYENSKFPTAEESQLLLDSYSSLQFENTERLALDMTKKYPKHQLAWKVLGALLIQTGRSVEALAANEKSVAFAPLDHEAHSNLGATQQTLGNIEEAEKHYKHAIKLKPGYAEAYCNLCSILQEQRKYGEAVEVCREAVRLKPSLGAAHANLGAALMELKEFKDASVYLQKALELEPNSYEIHGSLGSLLLMTGKHGEGLEHKLESDGAIYFSRRSGWRLSTREKNE